MQREHSLEGKLRKLQERADSKKGSVKVLGIKGSEVIYRCVVHGKLFRTIDGMYDARNLWACKLCASEHEQRGVEKRARPNFEKLLADKTRNPNGYRLKTWVSNSKAVLRCKTHGEFAVVPKNIKSRASTYWCAGCLSDFRAAGMDQRKPHAQFVKELRSVNPTVKALSRYEGANKKVTLQCKTCGHEWEATAHSVSVKGVGCPKCSWGRPTSKAEDELFQFVLKLQPTAQQSFRGLLGRKEVDIWIPERKIAIEYNGLYWHSDVRKAPAYHVKKFREVQAAGARLVSVYEDDWLLKPEVVKRFLTALLTDTKTVGARKCELRSGSATKAKSFLDKCHLQGSVRTGVAYGLFLEKRLVSVMVFDRIQSERGSKRDSNWELVRYASSARIAGGASRLLATFVGEHKPSSIISYSDNDFFDGMLYERLGFSCVKSVRHDYKVVIPKLGLKRFHKSRARRSELAKLLGPKFSPSLSEKENCDANGILRIYDAGKLKWKLTP